MYKRTVNYEDFDGNQRTEDFYFHLNKAELIQWLTCNGDYTLDKQLQRLYEASRLKDVMELFEDLLRRSYGKKSLDGRRFDKSDELWEDFKATEAYSIIFTELVSDAKKAGAFINAIIPKNLASEIDKLMEENKGNLPDEWKDYTTSDVLDANGELVPAGSVASKPADAESSVIPMSPAAPML